jgi:hypothetical protein
MMKRRSCPSAILELVLGGLSVAGSYFGDTIKAVVSRGGRPDLALSALDQVTAQHY